jgi:hypothetical protein
MTIAILNEAETRSYRDGSIRQNVQSVEMATLVATLLAEVQRWHNTKITLRKLP